MNYITEQDNYILDMYLNEELSNEDILDLYEYGYISEDVLEYIEENKLTRGIRELGHKIIKRYIQPKLFDNYKRDAYAHELKHVRRQLNDARKEGNQKAIDHYKNRANEIKTKGKNIGFAYSTVQSTKTGGNAPSALYKIHGNKKSKIIKFKDSNSRKIDFDFIYDKSDNVRYDGDDYGYDLSKSKISPQNNNIKVHFHYSRYKDDKGRIRPIITVYDKHTRRGNVIKLLNAISKDKR